MPAAPRRAVGVVPQFDNLDPDFTVTENLVVYGRYFGLADETIRARIPDLLEFAGLASRATARIQTLSGGMRRRLTLARALVNDPDFLVLDEPTTGLDPQARHVMWDRLKQLLARGKTILLTSHFMEEAERLCSRLVVMDRGRFIAEGSPRELIADANRAARGRSARRRTGRLVRAAKRARWRRASSARATRRSATCATRRRCSRTSSGRRDCAICTGRRTSRTCS